MIGAVAGLIMGVAAAQAPAPPPPTLSPGRLSWGQRMEGTGVFALRYSTGLGVGSSRDYVDQFSFLGLNGEGRYFAKPNVSIGLLVGWQTYYDKERSTETSGNVTVTADQVRYLDVIPVVATGHYYLDLSKETIHPYVGLAAGPYRVKREVWMNLFTLTDENWQFGLTPELGTIMEGNGIEMILDAKFSYLFKTGDLPEQLLLNFEFGFLLR